MACITTTLFIYYFFKLMEGNILNKGYTYLVMHRLWMVRKGMTGQRVHMFKELGVMSHVPRLGHDKLGIIAYGFRVSPDTLESCQVESFFLICFQPHL